MNNFLDLKGLENDNLLAWLAALGLLHALGRSRPLWSPRLCFAGLPKVPRLVTTIELSESEVAQGAAEGCSDFASAFSFEEADLNFDRDTATELIESTRGKEDQERLHAALYSDAAIRTSGAVDPTVFCAMFGQGHQHFLSRLHAVALSAVTKGLKNRKGLVPLDDPSRIERALFHPWSRSDATDGFRWDYAEERSYALRASNPSNDKPLTEHGASRLAILGLLSMASMPSQHGRYVRLDTRSVIRPPRTAPEIYWPIWTEPASLPAIETLLDNIRPNRDPGAIGRNFGVTELRRVKRTSVGKMFSFARAEIVPLPER